MTPIRNDTNTILKRSFYKRNTVVVAKDLLGKMLVSTVGNAVVSGTITETEAYGAENDPASHAFRGITERNKAMFGTVGCAYVYFIYGMHYCLNTVARDGISDWCNVYLALGLCDCDKMSSCPDLLSSFI